MKMEKLADILTKDLKVVFVGSAASNKSAEIGHYYANSQNKFWRLLYDSGLTDRQLSPQEDDLLLTFGYGLTDVVKTEQGQDKDLPTESFEEGRRRLKATIDKFVPRVVCFTSKFSYKAFFKNDAESYGLQPFRGLSRNVFVVPSPSPQVMADRLFNGKTRLEWFKDLAKFVNENSKKSRIGDN